MIYLNSNTSPARRLFRELAHGRKDIQTYWKQGMPIETRTFYLVEKVIMSVKQWHEARCPSYLVSGSLAGCKGHLSRIS